MSRRPLLERVMDAVLLPARVEKTLTITTAAGALTVTVTVNPSRGYVGQYFSITVKWTPVTGPGILSIDFGDGKSETPPPITPTAGGVYTTNHSYAAPKTYTITANVRDDATQATGTGTVPVTVANPLAVTFAADKTTGPVPLNATFTVGIDGGYPPYSYTLDFGDGTTAATGSRSSAGSFTVAHTYSRAGSYTAKVTVDDALGSTTMATTSIGAGVPILLPRLRKTFPRLFGKIDELRGRLAPKAPGAEITV